MLVSRFLDDPTPSPVHITDTPCQINAALMALGATVVNAVTSLTIEGNEFVNSKTGKRFQVVGMAYQPGGSAGYDPDTGKDPLSHKEQCMRDAALMQILGINAVRVYNLDPDINHDDCASIFNAVSSTRITTSPPPC